MKNYKKKLAIVISSLEVGGAEKMVLDLIKEIKNKINIILIVIKRNLHTIYDEEAKKLGVEVVYLNHRIKVFSLVVALKFTKVLKKYDPDIVHSHLKASTYVCFYNIFNNKFKWIHTIHTIANMDTKGLRRIFFRPLYNKNRVKLVGVSKTVGDSVLNLYKNAKVRIINNGINLNIFKYVGKKTKTLNLINVGRLENVKNHDYLLFEVSKLIKEKEINKLYIIGDGKRREHLNRLISFLELNGVVEIISYTSRVNEYLNISDIFVLSSHYEGMPLSVIEAMASGLIVIASAASSDVIINDYNGFIIDMDKNSLYSKLKEIIENIDYYDYIRVNAIKSSKKYSINKMADKYLELYIEEK